MINLNKNKIHKQSNKLFKGVLILFNLLRIKTITKKAKLNKDFILHFKMHNKIKLTILIQQNKLFLKINKKFIINNSIKII